MAILTHTYVGTMNKLVLTMPGMIIPVVEFSGGGGGCTKLERFLPKDQHTQEIIEF